MKTLTKIMFYIPKKFLIKLIFILFLLLSFNIYVNAETINNSSSSINQSCSTNGRFTYSLYGSNFDSFSTGSFKTKYNGVADYFVFDLDYDLLGNASYQLSISAISTDFRNINKSNVFIESSSDCATPTGLLDITNVSFSKSKIVINFKTTSNTSRFMVTLGDKGGPAITGISTFGISSIDITTIESNDTQNIIDNQNQNTNSIIDNQQQNTQDIIDNQNQNNEELKDTINENFNSCRPSPNLIDLNLFEPFNSYTTLDIKSDGVLVIGGPSGYTGAIYNINLDTLKTYTFVVDYEQLTSLTNLAINVDGFDNVFTTETGHFVYSFKPKSSSMSIGLWSSYNGLVNSSAQFTNIKLIEGDNENAEICTNKLDDTNDKLDNINGTLTDGSPPDTESFMEHLDDLFYDGPISTLILMPLTLINHYVDGFNSSCSAINLGSLYGTDLKLPCINLESKLGSSLWVTIDGLVSIFMIYNICMLFVSAFNDITSLRDTFDSLYVPQHGKPLGKHTSEVE